MEWPIKNLHTIKMREHSCWYSGEPALLADFYYVNELGSLLGTSASLSNKRNTFWGRMIKNNVEFCVHVPIASDIAETSASFLFGESPIIKVNLQQKDVSDVASDNPNQLKAQETVDVMLNKVNFFQKICEGAETASAIGGCYIKIVWDSEVCEYPIPLIVQADHALPEFKFGFLERVTFPYEYKEGNKVFRLMEVYEKGKITNTLYQGSDNNLGNEVPLDSCEYTKGLEPEVTFDIDDILVRYVPNMLPNRLDRPSRLGRSDLQGLESLMDSLDETFSSWMREVQLARGKIHIPEDYLGVNDDGDARFNIDKDIYVKLDVDPTNTQSSVITATQFVIHANELETTVLNLMDRIITSAGYSPQSFGLNIQGRAESGTALDIRERKSFATTNKKKHYWDQPLKDTIKNMCLLYVSELGGQLDANIDIDIAFADGITNNIQMLSTSVKMLSDAQAISTDTKVRMIHPEWSESQIAEEVAKILDEGLSNMMYPPDGFENPDIEQLRSQASKELGEGEEETIE